MKPVVEFTVQRNWQLVYDELRQAVIVNAYEFIPIPAFEIGWLFSGHILAIRATSTTAKRRWRYAGSLYQRLQLGSGGAASSLPTVDLDSRRIFLNRTVLIRFSEWTPEYELNFIAPYWLQDIRLTFWEYTGIHSDNITELLVEQKEDLTRIEGKIDAFY